MRKLITDFWVMIKSWFGNSQTTINAGWLARVAKETGKFEDDAPLAGRPSEKSSYDHTYPHTIGPLVSLSKEETDLIHHGKDAARRIVSAYYDYMGQFFMLFTGDGHSFMLPMSFFQHNFGKKPDPKKLSIVDHGQIIIFERSTRIAAATLLYVIQEMETRKNEKTGTRT